MRRQRRIRLATAMTYVGLSCVLIGVLAIVIPYIINVDRLKPALVDAILFKYTLGGFGVGAIGVGIAFWSLSVAQRAQIVTEASDDKMRAMAGLEFDEKMAVLESHIYRIRCNERPLSEQIYHDLKACVRLQEWIDEGDVEILRAKIQRLKEAIKEYKGTEHWQTNKYEELLSRLEALEQQVKGNVRVTTNGYGGSKAMEENEENRTELIARWTHERTALGQGISLLLLLNSVLFLGYVQIHDLWLGVVVACVGSFGSVISPGFLISIQKRTEELERRLEFKDHKRKGIINRIILWNSFIIFIFFVPIWVSALIFSIIRVW